MLSNRLALLVGLCVYPSAVGQPLFTPEVIRAGDSPDAVAVADLNGDGLSDIVAKHTSSRDVRIWLNLGNGRYSASPQELDILGSNEAGVPALGDVNGDGFVDLLVPVTGSYVVWVYLNDGMGFFSAAPFGSIPTSGAPRRVVAKDVNSDNHADYIITSVNDISVRINRGDGLPNLGAYSYPIVGDLDAVVVDDIDGDGDADIAAASSSSGQMYILTNDGGLFSEPDVVEVKGISGFQDFVAVDFNGDGDLDFVGSEKNGTEIAYIRNFGPGNFDGYSLTSFIAGFSGGRMDRGDIDGDGDLEVLVGNRSLSTQVQWIDLADLGPGQQGWVQVGEEAFGVAFGDFDGDGWLDILATGKGNDTLRIARGGSDGFVDNERISISGTRAPTKIMSADVNVDGSDDLLIGYDFNYSAPTGLLIDGATQDVQFFNDVMADFDLGDLDGDGFPDLVFITSSSLWGWAYNDQFGSFGPSFFRSNSDNTLRGISAGQVDGQGFDDVIVGTSSTTNLSTYLNLGPAFFTKQIDIPFVGTTLDTAFADLNGDSIPDVLALGRLRTLAVLHSNGAGDWVNGAVIDLLHYVSDDAADGKLVVTDLNGDPYVDVAILGSGVTTMLGNAAGLFEDEVVVPDSSLVSGGKTMKAGDIDHDGDMDLVVSYPSIDAVGVYLNHGGGATWSAPKFFGTDTEPSALELLDYDGDGELDILAGCKGILTVMQNRRGILCPGDVDQDGLVNLNDLQRLLFSFGAPGATPETGDIDLDHDVDLDDLQILLFAFGMSCDGEI